MLTQEKRIVNIYVINRTGNKYIMRHVEANYDRNYMSHNAKENGKKE